MLSADLSQKVRLRHHLLFSDFLNGILFHGHDVIDASLLHDCDSHESTSIGLFGMERMRDVIKQYDDGHYMILIGIENQNYRDEAMAMRILSYDFVNYVNQNKVYQKKKSSMNEGRKGVAFKLCPVMTIVVNYGEKRWKEAVSLKGMMKKIPQEFEDYVNDWKIKVVDVVDVNYKEFHQKENRDLIEGIQKLYGSKGEIEVLKGMDMSYETAIELFAVTKSPEMLEVVEGMKEEEFEMCTAIDLFKEKTMQVGIEKGKVIGFDSGKAMGFEIIVKNMYNKGVSIEDIVKLTNLNKEDIAKYLEV